MEADHVTLIEANGIFNGAAENWQIDERKIIQILNAHCHCALSNHMHSQNYRPNTTHKVEPQ